MTYTIIIKRQADKTLKRLDRTERQRIAEEIYQLGNNPDDPALDIKPLEGGPYFRLRVGGWRVIFDRQDEVRIIAIEKIKPRGDAYK
jgi:mRNA interferase RelE/StbE